MPTIEELKSKIEEAATLRTKVAKEYEKAQKKWTAAHKKYEKAINEYGFAMYESVKDKGDDALIEFFLTHPYEIPYDVLYKIRDEFFHSLGLHLSGSNSETGQSVIQVSFSATNTEKNAKTLASLRKCLPFIRPCAAGYKYIDMLEDSLNEHGSYYLHIYSEDDVKLSFMRYYRESITDLGTLDQAAAHIAEHYPYN